MQKRRLDFHVQLEFKTVFRQRRISRLMVRRFRGKNRRTNLRPETRPQPDSYQTSFSSIDEFPVQDGFPSLI